MNSMFAPEYSPMSIDDYQKLSRDAFFEVARRYFNNPHEETVMAAWTFFTAASLPTLIPSREDIDWIYWAVKRENERQ